MAARLIDVYDRFVEHAKISEQRLAKIGYTKLAIAATGMRKEKDPDVEEWLNKAETLSTQDLYEEVLTHGKTYTDIGKCNHSNIKKTVSWRCPDCRGYWTDGDPRKTK